MPSRLTLADALGGGEVTASRVADGWRARTVAGSPAPLARPTPAAVVGSGPDGPFVIDLCRDGPHVLVGGTTGSGKSEFLRTLVTSLAISSPPEELTFVLVDFKGGAAFGPCAGLPHVVGLVTDLDDHLVSRALASLRAELRRRERLLAAVGANDLEAYQRVRTPDSEPVPRLVVVVDELRALVEELPDFVTGLVRLAALGRSLGVHLVLATQRPSGAVSAEVQANVSLRIAFRVRDRADSVDVLDDGSAAGIPPSTPGRALARGADGALVTFQAAIVAAPRVRSVAGLTVRRSTTGGEGVDPAQQIDDAEVGSTPGVVAAVRDAHRLLGGRPPRAPWLAPLPSLVPALAGSDARSSGVPRVVGLVDEPELQRITALAWDAAGGTWLLSGGSGSGRTTALRALALAAAAGSGPDSLHLHVIDAHGSLADLGALPHLGTRVRTDDQRACAALVRHLREEVDRRLGAAPATGPSSVPTPRRPTTLVLVDGWDQLVEAQPAHDPDPLIGSLLRVLRDGRSVGIVGAVSGGRSLLHPRWGEVAGRSFLLGSIDPLDAALAGLRTIDLPRDPPPGRAVRVHDKREVQFARASPDDTSTVARGAVARPAEGAAWRWIPLPAVVRRADVQRRPGQTVSGAGHAVVTGAGHPDDRVLLGVGGDHGGAVLVAARHGRTPAARRRAIAVRALQRATGGRGVPVRRGSTCRRRELGGGRHPDAVAAGVGRHRAGRPRGPCATQAETPRPRGVRRRRRPAGEQRPCPRAARDHRPGRPGRRAGRSVDLHHCSRHTVQRDRRRGGSPRVLPGAEPHPCGPRPCRDTPAGRHPAAAGARGPCHARRGHRGPGAVGRGLSRAGRSPGAPRCRGHGRSTPRRWPRSPPRPRATR